MQYKAIQQIITDHEIKFIDLRFTDSLAKEHHVTIPAHAFTQDLINNGQPFDGSSISGWQGIECSDMILKPDVDTLKLDPFYEQNTLFVTCDVIDPATGDEYVKCPRGVAFRAEKFLKESGIADTA